MMLRTVAPCCAWKVPVCFAYTKYKHMLADVQRIHRISPGRATQKTDLSNLQYDVAQFELYLDMQKRHYR